MTNAELRQAERDKKVFRLFRSRHANPGHDRYVTRESAGDWERVECCYCDVVVNFRAEDLT